VGAGYSDVNLFSNYTHLQKWRIFRANSSYDRKSVNVHAKQNLVQKGSLSSGNFTVWKRLFRVL
jgi:iron complex outermembrane receptor protein